MSEDTSSGDSSGTDADIVVAAPTSAPTVEGTESSPTPSATPKKKRQFSIMMKISVLILFIVAASISSYAAFAVWQFKNDKLKYIYVVNSTFTSTIAKTIQSNMKEIVGDMQNIVSLLGVRGIDKEKSRFLMVIFQNNDSFASLNVFRAGEGSLPSPSPSADTAAVPTPTPVGETVPVIDETPVEVQAGASPSPMPDLLNPPALTAADFSQSYALFNKDFLALNQLSEDTIKEISIKEIQNYTASPVPRKNPYFVDNSKFGFLTFIYPLDDKQSYFAVFNVSKEFLYEAVSESEVNEPFVVDEKGNVLMHVDRSKVGQFVSDLPIFEHAKANPFREGGTEFTRKVDGQDRSYVGNFYKLSYGLLLLAQADKSRAFEGMQRIILNTILFAVNLVGLSIIVGVIFSKTLTAPLQSLMQVTENIAAGNYKVQSTIKTNDEVGQLADYFVALGHKLDEREAQLEKATELAIKDGMTGVYNHRHFRNRFNEFFSLAKRHDRELSLILTDIDFFKKFNDTYGHQQGDQVIKDIAQILLQSTRTTDFVARYGGEEFVVVLPDTDKVGATQAAEKIRQNYKNHKIKNLAGEGYLQSTCSLGVSTVKASTFTNIDEMIEHADKNLYAAKKGGRDRVVAD